MKPLTLTLASLAALGLVACQRQAAPQRTEAVPTPSPVAASASTASGDTQPGSAPIATAEAPAGGHVDSATGVRIEDEPAPAARPKKRVPSSSGRSEAPVRQTERPVAESNVARPPAEPAPAPQSTARREEPEAVVLPEGTELSVRLTEPIASDTSNPEDAVVAETVEPVRHQGRVVIPAGAEVVGHIVVAQRSGRVKGRARLVIGFEEVRVRNRSYQIEAARWDVSAASSKGRDAKVAGGAAAAGAIIGAITGGGSGALKGAVIGGAAGGAAVLITRGNEVELPAGVVRKVVLRSALRIQ